MDTLIASAALALSLVALVMSVYFWRRQFRPIVTAMVKTHAGGNNGIAYILVVLNSGSIPARDIKFEVVSQVALADSFGSGADGDNKKRWLACFDATTVIPLLHNGAHLSCSFGATEEGDRGFWKNRRAEIPIIIRYKGWFGKAYDERQTLRIVDSDSFTGFMWA
ncbi:hypothetical protein [Mesorhizobium temperatum]|uniref:hypothetical protein n=1 Tax=Mesorhizobium temperatum TaxID=241416 RepID=UPI000BA8F569|nr:hypothetical protein [Mesorhizobium temperatum]